MNPAAKQEELLEVLSELAELETTKEPTKVIRDAIRRYEEEQEKQRFADAARHDEAWSILANQVVGHEGRR